MKKIWGDYDTHPLIESFIKGDDLAYDGLLLRFDIVATDAHIVMLENIGALSANELKTLKKALKRIDNNAKKNDFNIPNIFEDCHSFLETTLISQCGELGKKVHFLRSRNDQSLTMIRLYMKYHLQIIMRKLAKLEAGINKKKTKHKDTLMPGYTHMQKAMPALVSDWFGSYADALFDAQKLIKPVYEVLDQNPLGSGAGFGFVGQKIQPDKQVTTEHMAFKSIQENPFYGGLSRGNFEIMVLESLHPIALLASQFAVDVLMYTMDEFQFMSLPDDFTTGSSIMPQKRNYDVLEILRGKESEYWSYINFLQGIVTKKSSGYQRDLQLTKKPIIEGLKLITSIADVWTEIVEHIILHENKLNEAISGELYATSNANLLVAEGMSFRDAYMKVKKDLEKENG